MKITSLILIILSALFVQSCKKDNDQDPKVQNGTVLFVFENYIDNNPIVFGGFNATNSAGNVYSVDLLKYYISNISFTRTDNSVVKLENYELINEDIAESKSFAVMLPYGDYNSVKFYVGVDSLKNVSGAQAGELDPVYGMFWDWNTGYIYFKHEGNFIETNGDTLPIVYHYGTLDALTSHDFPLSMSVNETTRIIKVRFDLNKLYNSPNVVDFHNNNIHSGGANFINTLRENFADVFSVSVY